MSEYYLLRVKKHFAAIIISMQFLFYNYCYLYYIIILYYIIFFNRELILK